jgi:hypothetical protein
MPALSTSRASLSSNKQMATESQHTENKDQQSTLTPSNDMEMSNTAAGPFAETGLVHLPIARQGTGSDLPAEAKSDQLQPNAAIKLEASNANSGQKRAAEVLLSTKPKRGVIQLNLILPLFFLICLIVV